MRLVGQFLLITLLVGCQPGPASVDQPVFDEQSFAALYADILIVRGQTNPALNQDKRVSALLQQHEMSVETYDQILAYYQKYPDEWLTFLDRVDSLITARTAAGTEL